MKVWWSRTPALGNFGDILTPYLLSHYGIRYEYQTRKAADTLCVGSIIRFARRGMTVIGSGAISAEDRVPPDAKYLFVRGPITGEIVRRCGGACPDVYGDPALVLPEVFIRDVWPSRDVGLFAHYVDLGIEHPFVISPLGDPLSVLRKVWSCERIISSSLHGIIAAHAYGIPAAWVKISDKLTGDDTKFHDYAQSVGMDRMPLSTLDHPVFTLPECDRSGISAILRGLRN